MIITTTISTVITAGVVGMASSLALAVVIGIVDIVRDWRNR